MTSPCALVTGASRGIGLGVAQNLARRGYALTISSRNEADLRKLAAHLIDLGAEDVVYAAADMADRDDVKRIVEAHTERYATMSALVLSAGVGTAGRIIDFPLTRLDKTLQVNFVAAFMLIQDSLPLLRAAVSEDPLRGAKIIALSSITGVYAEPGLAAYGASKAALLSLIDTVNAEESRSGVSACAIAPGYVDTDMSAWTTDTIPSSTMIPVEDVVAVVDMVLRVSRNVAMPAVVMSRTSGESFRA